MLLHGYTFSSKALTIIDTIEYTVYDSLKKFVQSLIICLCILITLRLSIESTQR